MRQFTLSAAVLVLVAAAPAVAAPAAYDPNAMSVTVATSDLDLGDAADRIRLDARIDRAADAVCDAGDMRGVAARRSFAACKAAAMRAGRARTERAVAAASGAAAPVLASRR